MRALLAAVVVAAALVVPTSAPASARTVTAVFTGMPSPAVTCAVQTGATTAGQRWCTTTVASQPTRVQSFDGTPIDVSVFLPKAPASGPDGGYPLVGIYHGWGGSKAGQGTAQRWLQAGYAVFSMTDRGWFESCGTPQSRQNLPSWATCANGDVNFFDYRYETRDAQYLIGHLVDEGLVDPDRIGAFGGSYGGIASSTLAALNSRIVTGVDAAGQPVYAPWTSPAGVPLHIAGAAPAALGSDLIYTQQPNGSTLDYVASTPYFAPNGTARVGVQKAGVMNGFLDSVGTRATLSPAILYLQSQANAPGPYDDMHDLLAQTIATHSAYNVDTSVAPAPMIMSDGWNDDFVGADESIKLYNKIRATHPEVPVAMYFGDLGHPRSQDKPQDAAVLDQLRTAWMDYYVRDRRTGTAPPQNVQLNPFTCTAANTVTATIASWAKASAGEVRLTTSVAQTVAASGTKDGLSFFGPDTTACATVDAADNPATANYRTAAATGAGYDIRGGALLLLKLQVTGASDQLAVRLLDVGTDGKERLVERGLLRPKRNVPNATQYLQLHPSYYHVAAGHSLKLELLPDDAPYSHVNPTSGADAARQHPIVVRGVELRVPTVQAAGASGGLVQAPQPRYLPAGFALAPGF